MAQRRKGASAQSERFAARPGLFDPAFGSSAKAAGIPDSRFKQEH